MFCWITLRLETLWSGRFGQNDILPRVTFWPWTLRPKTVWPERQFGQCHFGWWQFGQWHFGQSDTLARHFGQSDSLASFSCFLWGTKGWIKTPCGGPLGKIWKKSWPYFSEKWWLFFQIFPYGSPYGIFIHPWYPKGSKKNWP